ncbi:MAG: hypothetical protein ABIQ56_06000, partial [Chitinophagaceae bacterium]
MALSKIWSAFIIIAIAVAGFKFFISENDYIFTSMVTGKAGDTLRLQTLDSSKLEKPVLRYLDSNKSYSNADVNLVKYSDNSM